MIVHQLCHGSLTKSVIEGDVEGHTGRGRPRMENIKQIMMEKDRNKELKELSYV